MAAPLAAAVTASLSLLSGTTLVHAESSGSAGIYVFQDTNDTTVIAPRGSLRVGVTEETHVTGSYSVDVWTSASVDIVSSASQPVTEQRDEIQLGLDHRLDDITLAANYRFSSEPDYTSHGGSLSLTWELAQKATTLVFSLGGSIDGVGRVGEPGFSEDVSTFTAGANLTQVIDADTLVQVIYDVTSVRGYQTSPYRLVPIGALLCSEPSQFCLPEENPRERLRQAGMVRLRRALSESLSAGAGYRLYLDNWGIMSHTGVVDVAWSPVLRSAVALSYRFYTQGAADHFQPEYDVNDLDTQAFFTRDKELSPLTSHRVGLELTWLWPVAEDGAAVSTGLELGPTFYSYSDFPLLEALTGSDQILAFEVTALVGMELE